MESDSWNRISTYSRRYQSRSDAYHGEEYEGEEEQKPEFLCPFCVEDFDIVGLCCHMDEEHAVESKNGVCPVCAKRVGSDLVRHLTVQHGNILKVQRRRRLRRGSNLSFSNVRRESREGNYLQAFLGGSSLSVPSSHAEPDPLLNSFICSPPHVEEASDVQPISSSVEAGSMAEHSIEETSTRVVQKSPLSDEDKKEKVRRCEFVRGLLISTFLDDSL